MIPTAKPATTCLTDRVAAGLSKFTWICSLVVGQKRGWYPRIIKGRPFGVGFECRTQTSPERSTLL